MSTRCMIGVERADGTIHGIYLHCDGARAGAILLAHYADPAKVAALIDLGDLSTLGAEIGERHPFSERFARSGECTAYGRDRGETQVGPTLYDDRADFAVSSDTVGACYLFAAGQWLTDASGAWAPVASQVTA